MRRLRSALFVLFFLLGSVVAAVLAVPAAWFGREPLTVLVLTWARYHRWCARLLLGIRSAPQGVIPAGPILFAAKHQSMFETVELILLIERPAVVLKRELADLPLWGRAARRYGVIPIDRTAGAAALRAMLRAAAAAKAEGRAVLIFPEGTRVLPGERPPLQPGFAGLYRSLGIPVVPVALDAGRLWPRTLVKRPGIVTMRFGDPIPPGLSRDEIEERVHQGINALED